MELPHLLKALQRQENTTDLKSPMTFWHTTLNKVGCNVHATLHCMLQAPAMPESYAVSPNMSRTVPIPCQGIVSLALQSLESSRAVSKMRTFSLPALAVCASSALR